MSSFSLGMAHLVLATSLVVFHRDKWSAHLHLHLWGYLIYPRQSLSWIDAGDCSVGHLHPSGSPPMAPSSSTPPGPTHESSRTHMSTLHTVKD